MLCHELACLQGTSIPQQLGNRSALGHLDLGSNNLDGESGHRTTTIYNLPRTKNKQTPVNSKNTPILVMCIICGCISGFYGSVLMKPAADALAGHTLWKQAVIYVTPTPFQKTITALLRAGSIPKELGALSQLLGLQLGGNQLTGSFFCGRLVAVVFACY